MKRLLLFLSFVFQLSVNASDSNSEIDVQIINEITETTKSNSVSVPDTAKVQEVVAHILRSESPNTSLDDVFVMHRGSPVALSESVRSINNPDRMIVWIKNRKMYQRDRSHSAPTEHSKIKIITVFYGHQTEQFELYPKTTWKDLKKQIYQAFHVKPIDPDDIDLARVALEKDKQEGGASHTSQRIVDGRLREYVLDTFKKQDIKELQFYLYLQPFKNQHERFDMVNKSMEQLAKEQRFKQLAKAIAPDIKKYNLSRLKLRKAVNMLTMGYNKLGELEGYRQLAESLQEVAQEDQEDLFYAISEALRGQYYQEQEQNKLLLQERADFSEQDNEEDARFDAMMEALVLEELASIAPQPLPVVQTQRPANLIPEIIITPPSDDEETF